MGIWVTCAKGARGDLGVHCESLCRHRADMLVGGIDRDSRSHVGDVQTVIITIVSHHGHHCYHLFGHPSYHSQQRHYRQRHHCRRRRPLYHRHLWLPFYGIL